MITEPAAGPLHRPASSLQGQFVDAAGLRTHVLRAGTGRTLLLLHGWPEWSHCWHRLMPRLEGRFALVAPDFRGFGLTADPVPGAHDGNTPERYGADILALADALGLDRFGIVSHDVGSNVAQWLARTHPERVAGLFFFSCTHPGIGARWAAPDQVGEIWYQAFNALPWAAEVIGASRASCRAYLQHCLSRWSADPHSFDDLLETYVDNFMRPGNLQGGFNWYRASQPRRLAVMRGEVPGYTITQPTHVLWGARDRVLRPQWTDRLGEYFADLAVELAPHSGHFPHLEEPALAAARIDEFFSRRVRF